MAIDRYTQLSDFGFINTPKPVRRTVCKRERVSVRAYSLITSNYYSHLLHATSAMDVDVVSQPAHWRQRVVVIGHWIGEDLLGQADGWVAVKCATASGLL